MITDAIANLSAVAIHIRNMHADGGLGVLNDVLNLARIQCYISKSYLAIIL